MNTLHVIESDDIEHLESGQLVGLLRVLLYAEAKPKDARVLVPAQITVSDGGEDGRWEGPTSTIEYIPKEFTLYQSKAENLDPQGCVEELFESSGALKPALLEVLQRNGAYVFFCSHGLTQTKIRTRLEKAFNALCKVRKSLRASPLHFLDGNRIAAWTNCHVAAVAYVAKCCRLPEASYYRTWTDWSRDPVFNTKFHSNATLDKFISQLRGHLLVPKAIARITGFSGLGKTRLGFETLRPPDSGADVQRAILSYSCAYIDAACVREPLATVHALEVAELRGLVVVDNCVRSLHVSLSDVVNRRDCKLSLLTMDYEPESAAPGALHIQLDPTMLTDIVPKILKSLPAASKLTEPQLAHISSFAAGFPQIAVLMAETGDTLDFQGLNDRKLAERILWGHGAQDPKAHDALTALALFTSVGFDSPKDGQKIFVRDAFCGEHNLTGTEFNRLLKQFERRRIVQTAGLYRFVTPAPLAVALAAQWWDTADVEEVTKLLPGIEAAGLTGAFSDRIQHLHFSSAASTIVAHMVGANGPLGAAEVLNSGLGSQLFRAIVEVNPAAATDCLWRVYGKVEPENLRQVYVGRRNLVWALEKLCWERAQFAKAAALLLRFAAAENERWANNATGQFVQLFQIYLPGTETALEERLSLLEVELEAGEAAVRRVCVSALGVGLKSGSFSRSGGVEVRGSGLPRRDYEPKSNQEILDYRFRCFLLLERIALDQSSESAAALAELGNKLRTVVHPGLLSRIEPSIRRVAEATDHYWPEALRTIKGIFEFEKENFPEDVLSRLQEWQTWLMPLDMAKRIALLVTDASFEHELDGNGHYFDLSARKAKALADEIVDQHYDLSPCLDVLQKRQQRQAFDFGTQLGKRSPVARRLIEECLHSLRRIPSENRDTQLLSGILHGLSDRQLVSDTLDFVAGDSDLREVLVSLTRRALPGLPDIARVDRLIRAGAIPAWHLGTFATGSCLDHLAPDQMISIFRPLALDIESARAPVLEVFAMYIFHSDERWRACRDFFRELVMLPKFLFGVQGTMDGHHWQDISIKLLGEKRDDYLATELVRQILAAQNDPKLHVRGDTNRRAVLAELLKSYASVTWPILGAELLTPEYYNLEWLLEGPSFEEEGPSLLWNLPPASVVTWAAENPKGRTRLGSMMNLFTVEKDGGYKWHPISLALFEHGVDEEFVRAMERKLLHFGSIGSRVPYMARRIDLLRTLEKHSERSVREMAKRVIGLLEEVRAQESKRDEEVAAGIRRVS